MMKLFRALYRPVWSSKTGEFVEKMFDTISLISRIGLEVPSVVLIYSMILQSQRAIVTTPWATAPSSIFPRMGVRIIAVIAVNRLCSTRCVARTTIPQLLQALRGNDLVKAPAPIIMHFHRQL
jgi:hypothetical protein